MKLSWLRQVLGTRAFFRSLPWRPRIVVFTAVFFTFCSFGFIIDSMNVRNMSPWACVLGNAAFIGSIGVLYLLAASTTRKLYFVAIAFQFVAQLYLLPLVCRRMGHEMQVMTDYPAGATRAGTTSDLTWIDKRLHADAVGCIVCIMLGYAVLIRFVAWEGRKYLRLRTEVELAEHVHSTLVPPVRLVTPRFELFGRSEPSSEVGGDLLDVIERDGGLVACVADVSGHGVSAGSIMGMVKSAVRMKLLSALTLQELLDDLNEVVCQVRTPETFVTFAGLRFDTTNVAEVGLAGHLPVLRFPRASGPIETIENEHPPLGVVDKQRHRARRVAFEPGDLFVLLTDGLTEVVDGKGEQFGIRGVEEVVRRHQQLPLAELYASLLAAVRAHGPQTDDQTLLLVRAGTGG